MSGTTWTKFFWSDWQSDPALRLCSYAARGLWMDMLCIAAAHDPIGYVAVAGRALDETDIARMTGGSESEVRSLLGELDRNGVFSRDRHGRIYSRRMITDARRAAVARKNGKMGGNPSLGKGGGKPDPDNPPDNTPLKTQKPEARSQKKDPLKSPKGDGDDLFGQEGEPERPPDLVEVAFAAWNELARDVGLPVAKVLDKARRRSIAKRLSEGGIEGWREALAGVERSAFLRGLRPGSDGRKMRADLGFVCQARSFPRLREGFYGDDAPPRRPQVQAPTWPGPPEIRAAVVEATDNSFAASWLDRCAWRDLPDKAVVSDNGFVVDTLKREVGPVLGSLGVTVRLEEAA